MRQAAGKILYPFLLPNGMVFIALAVALAQPELPGPILPFVEVFPYAMAGVGLLLGWRFNRTRLVQVTILLTLTECLVLQAAAAANESLLFDLIPVLLPLNLWLVSCCKERGLLHRSSLLWGVLLAAEVLVFAWLLQAHQPFLRKSLDYPLLPLPQSVGLPVSQLAVLVNSLVLLFFFGKSCRRNSVFEAGFFWAQLLLIIPFLGDAAQPFRLYLSGAGLMFVLGVMESSYSLAYRDELTGLLGRRALDETLARLGSCYSVAMLDIDHFKKFNDTHGHDVGDQVLKMVASKLARVSGGGKVFRYGGEEFAVIFPRKSVKEARPFLEALRAEVEAARFVRRGKDRPRKRPKTVFPGKRKQQPLKVTISIGVAERTDRLTTAGQVLKAADQALYRAKKGGRNQVRD